MVLETRHLLRRTSQYCEANSTACHQNFIAMDLLADQSPLSQVVMKTGARPCTPPDCIGLLSGPSKRSPQLNISCRWSGLRDGRMKAGFECCCVGMAACSAAAVLLVSAS